ncbi:MULTISPECIES: mycofactocin-coupled SDR family oxidoreductase [Frankia]|uniref:Short-chain dehydrogenase n=1 Tax=Frankia alni (strain DSM 45986 / CECT 9034 / ACN14a) TaxID=326424 RepID=Q0RMT1_FRAAA|nr:MULTISPECIES: mycofactocin-coupled SDR family oxidoreductase [Frankia]CAJ61166.1 Putative short-chain dehydrogenase [Frankia alni ACN14a]
MGRMDGKVAFVTGAARGQGRAHALRLAEEGADIIAVDLCGRIGSVPYDMATADDLAETIKEIEALDRRVVGRQADVRKSGELDAVVEQAISELGPIDVVCANAGIFSMAPFSEITDEMWDDMLAVNLTGVFRTVRAVLPSMIESGRGGSIVLISSAAGLVGFANFAHYTAAKHGVIGLMRTLVNEISSHGIRVNTVHPNSVDTKMIMNDATYRLFDPANPTRERFGEIFQTLNPMRIPWVEPVDVSNAVLYLASDESRYVTGAMIPVDGGFLQKV